MPEIAYFRRLFDYDDWANRVSLASVEPLGLGRPLEFFGHVLGASRLWLERFSTPDPKGIEVWPKPTVAQCREAIENLHRDWAHLLDGLTAERLAGNLSYRNTKGVAFSTPVADVLTHAVMHAAYHRGQVAAAVRAAGGQPAATDYVVWVRQGLQAGAQV